MSTTPGSAHRALRVQAGAGTFTVGGLDTAEVEAVSTAWSRCAPEPVDVPAAEVDLQRAASGSWEAFHEAMVFGATNAAITASRGSRLLLHAACLADPTTGAAVALVAASGTGKTTATRRLGPHFSYLTDETAIVDPEGLGVLPYPKPLSLLGAAGTRPKTQAGPDELGLGATLPDARLAGVAVLGRVREPHSRGEARAEPMGLVEALQELAPQTSSLSHLPRGLVTLCALLDRLGGARRLVYSEAEELRPLLTHLLSQPAEPVEASWEPLGEADLAPSSPAGPDDADSSTGGDDRVRRVGVDDGVLTDTGALVLLHGSRLIVLEGLGPALWFLLAEALTFAEVLRRLSMQGPVPPDAEERVRAALRDLESHALVTT